MHVIDVDRTLVPEPVALSGLIDPRSFSTWDVPMEPCPHEAPGMDRARARTGLDESVVTGAATVSGHPVAVIAVDFNFLGGSVGVRSSARMVGAIRRATAGRLPLLISTASGGTRVTEGTRAFAMMMPIAAALSSHRKEGLLYVAYLRHPTLGGAFASWGSMAHFTLAEPGARVGFLGPKVHSATTGTPMPAESQSAEQLYTGGRVDRIATVEGARAHIADLLQALASEASAAGGPRVGSGPRAGAESRGAMGPVDDGAMDVVQRSQDPRRPTAQQFLAAAWPGTFSFSDRDSQVGLAIAPTEAGPLFVIAQRRGGTQPLRAADLRAARSGIEIATDLGLPILTIVDTAGAESSPEAEREGIGQEIAHTMGKLLRFPGPVVSVLLGEGAGGGAIAMLPSDHMIAAEHSWLAPLPLAGISALVYRDPHRLGEVAGQQGLTAREILAAGIIDEVVPEHPDAAAEPIEFSRRLALAVQTALAGLRGGDYVSPRLAKFMDQCAMLETRSAGEGGK